MSGIIISAADLLPRGQRVKIPGAGHNVRRTQPEAVLEAVVQFLERLI